MRRQIHIDIKTDIDSQARSEALTKTSAGGRQQAFLLPCTSH